MKQPLFFRIYKDGQLVEIKQVQGDQAVIGSNDDVEISLKDESVSPIHATVEERESGFYLCDLGSGGGTQLNGQTVLDSRIQSGDEIQVGVYTVEFYVGVPKPKSKPPRTAESATPLSGGRKIPATPPQEAKVQSKPSAQKPNPNIQTKSQTVAKTGAWKKVEVPATRTTNGLETVSSEERRPSSKGTYAPASARKDLKGLIKPTKGTVVEIVVAWDERILSTYHYDQRKVITVGAHPKNDIVLPVFGSSAVSHPLVRIEGAAQVFITSDMRGELLQGEKAISLHDLNKMGRATPSGAGSFVVLQQGELLRIDFTGGVSIYIRYVAQAPKPVAAPFLDLSSSEITTIVGSAVLMFFIALYFAVYAPQEQVEEAKEQEPPRRAVFLYKPKIEPVSLNETESKPSEKAKLSEKDTRSQEKAPIKPSPQKAASKDDEGKSAEARPNKSKSQEKKLTTPNPGKNKGIQKAAAPTQNKKNDASGKSVEKDVTKTGILSVLSGKGTQDRLSKVYSGAGVVGGLSQSATGSGSQSAVGAGDTPGEGLKGIGKGGTGEATVGISGVNTKGRGSGNQGYGTGSIGDKKNATVVPGGAEESFDGTIDKDAIRRVILANMRQIKACYERALNKDPGLHGKIVVRWVIAARGKVRQAGIASSTMGSSEVEQCIVSRFRTWQFPEPPVGQEAEVTYPFVFAAQN